MSIYIRHIEYYLPQNIVSNEDLQLLHPDWDIKKVGEKSGVFNRHIAGENETAFDLACEAIQKIFDSGMVDRDEIDGIIFCTQSPDFIMPSNAFLIHKHFGFDTRVWSFDYNLACSGYIYGLALCRGMIETGMASNILLINGDTYSKYINADDRSTSVLFGDGASASIISKREATGVMDVILESSGKEYDSFYIPGGGCRLPKTELTKVSTEDHSGNKRTQEDIHMNGFAVWKFISNTVPKQINELLARNKMEKSDVAFFGFHQASKLTIDSLIKSLQMDPSKVYLNLDRVGNTVSASIPIALKDAETANKLKRGDLVILSGFGVGLSWGSLLMKY